MDIIKPLTAEAIALNEKKMNMTLDDIIKMSKKTVSKVKRTRILNKSRGFLNRGSSQVNSSLKVQKFNNSRSSLRQSVLAQKRANFRGNKFPVATGAARKVVQTPIRNKVVNWKKPRVVAPMLPQRKPIYTWKGQKPQTLDWLFADMKGRRQGVWWSQQMRGGQWQRQMQINRRAAARPGTGGFFNGIRPLL